MKKAPPREAAITKAIAKYLKSVPGVWYMKVHGGPYGRAGIPDIIGAYRGLMFALEVKRPGNTTTAIQDREMENMRASCIRMVRVVHSVDDAKAAMKHLCGLI